MKIHKISAVIMLILVAFSVTSYFFFADNSIVGNMSRAILGSAFLALIINFISYFVERRACLVRLLKTADTFVIQAAECVLLNDGKSLDDALRAVQRVIYNGYSDYSEALDKLDFTIKTKKSLYGLIFGELQKNLQELYNEINQMRHELSNARVNRDTISQKISLEIGSLESFQNSVESVKLLSKRVRIKVVDPVTLKKRTAETKEPEETIEPKEPEQVPEKEDTGTQETD